MEDKQAAWAVLQEEADPIQLYASVMRGVTDGDKNIRVNAPALRENKKNKNKNENKTSDDALRDALTDFYYNFPTYVMGTAKSEELHVDRESAGSLLDPNVALLLERSNPAPFGLGEETVYDPSVRLAKNISGELLRTARSSSLYTFSGQVKEVATALSPRCRVKVELSKLHVYEEGGHFAPHRDTLRSHDHIGSVVVLLGSAFTGGEFLIDGEVCPLAVDREKGEVQFVAFHTDRLHEVRPVTSGVRVSLQFDVFRAKQNEEGEFDEPFGQLSKWIVRPIGASAPLVDEGKCDALVAQVKERLRSTATAVKHLILPAFHRYTQYALHHGSLQPIDDCLVRKLQEQGYEVAPVPVNLIEETYDCYDHPDYSYTARIFWKGPFGDGKPQSAPAGTEFVALARMEGTYLDSQGYIEYTGNEAQPAVYTYHLAGFLINAPTNSANPDSDPEPEKSDDGDGAEEAEAKRRRT